MKTFDFPPVDGEVEPHQLGELGVTVAQHVGEIMGPVQVGVDGADAAAFTVKVAVDLSSNAGQLGNQVHGVFIDELRKATETVEFHIPFNKIKCKRLDRNFVKTSSRLVALHQKCLLCCTQSQGHYLSGQEVLSRFTLTSQYLDLCTPSEYARAKLLSLFRAVMAALN